MWLTATIRRHGWAKITLVILDWLAITIAAIATLVLHYFTGIDEYDTEHSMGEYIMRVAILYASFPLLVLIFRQHLLYKQKIYSTGVMQFAQLSRALLINALLLIAVLFFVRQDWILHSRINLLLFTLCSLAFLSLFRIVLFRNLLLPAISGIEVRRILLVGVSDNTHELLAHSMSRKNRPFEVVAIVAPHGNAPIETPGVLMLHTVPYLIDFIPAHNIHEVVVAENDLPYEDVIRLIAEARETGVPIHLLSDHFKVVQERVTKSASEFLNVTATPISHGLHGFYGNYLKHVLDLVGAAFGIIILSPFLCIIALAIKIGSRGPLFYTSEVIGQNGKSFRWYKFRTMYLGKDDGIHREHVSEHIRMGDRPTGKIENDPRVTPFGAWLRKHSLDELPQLWSVVRGNMSLVGPRPCLPYEYEQYAGWHKGRFAVRPGLTAVECQLQRYGHSRSVLHSQHLAVA